MKGGEGTGGGGKLDLWTRVKETRRPLTKGEEEAGARVGTDSIRSAHGLPDRLPGHARICCTPCIFHFLCSSRASSAHLTPESRLYPPASFPSFSS